MQLAYDAATAGGFQVDTFSHTVGSGSKRLLIVVTAVDTSTTSDVSGVTYGGVVMTQLASAAFTLGNYSMRVWYLFDPASGAANVVMTGPTAPAGVWTSGAVSYAGAKSTNFPDAVNTSSGTGTPYTKSITTVASNAWTLFITLNDGGNASASTGSTSRVATDTGAFTRYLDIFDSNGPLTPGSNSMSATQAGGPNWANAMISLAPAVDLGGMMMVF